MVYVVLLIIPATISGERSTEVMKEDHEWYDILFSVGEEERTMVINIFKTRYADLRAVSAEQLD